MIYYTDIIRRDDVPFDQYLKIPGYSQSFLKNEINGIAPGVDVTDNMRLGTMVDQILTEPHKVNMSDTLYEPGKKIASKIMEQYGSVINVFQKQASYTGVANYNGFKLKVKGRLDFLLPKHAVIDLKVTACRPNQIQTLIKWMGYDKQLWHYARLGQVPKGYLIIYSRPVKSTFLIQVDVSSEVDNFWADKIEKFGLLEAI